MVSRARAVGARIVTVVGIAAVVSAMVAGSASATSGASGPRARVDRSLPASTRLYVEPRSKAAAQARGDLAAGDRADAVLMAKLASWPVATWFTGGTAEEVRSGVAALEHKAALRGQVPVVALYDIPGRDCSQYSAGGAEGTAAYEAWIDGAAAGIGARKTVVILEPDGIALSPDQCGGTAAQQADRNEQLNYAVSRLEQQPKAIVYVDAGHSSWHAVGDIAERLIAAGVANAQGFFLNVSNYRTDAELTRYGSMVSQCIWYLTNTPGAVGSSCPNQWWPTADADAWYAANVPAGATLTHYVIDSSRNGQGPWTPTATYTDAQDWCNPPARGLGVRPTVTTGTPLLDAYLWVKVPGESDGSCTRGTGGTIDPEWGVVDPTAGTWWPDQARQLAQLAVPTLTFNRPAVR